MRLKIKRLALGLTLALAAAALAGCMHMNVKLTINADGSAEYGVDMTMSDALLGMARSQGQDVWGDAAKQLEEEGFTVKPLEDGDYKGIRATKRFASVGELNGASLGQAGSAFGDTKTAFGVKADKGFFGTTVTIDSTLDASSSIPTKDSLDEATAAMLEQVKAGMQITLPVKAASHNATAVSEDGLTYTWEFKLDQPNAVRLAATVPDADHIRQTGIDAALALKADGSSVYTVRLFVPDTNAEAQGGDVWTAVSDRLKAEGFAVEPMREEGCSGLRAVKAFKNVGELNAAGLDYAGGLFTTPAASLTATAPETGFFGTTLKIRHNAVEVSDDGWTYTWDMNANPAGITERTVTIPNWLNVSLAGGAALIVIAAAVIFVLVLNARKRRAARRTRVAR